MVNDNCRYPVADIGNPKSILLLFVATRSTLLHGKRKTHRAHYGRE
jgi:hypothetical protein